MTRIAPVRIVSKTKNKLPETIDLCEVRHDLEDNQLQKFPTDVRSPKTIVCRRLFACGQSMHQFKDFCLGNPLGSYLWKLSGHSPMCFRITHTGEKPLVLFSEDSLTVLVCTVCIPSFSDATESTAFGASAKGHKHLLLQGKVTRQSAKPPARPMAFIAGLLIDP